MKLEIEILDGQAEMLLRWSIPPEHCGPSLAERIAYLIDDACLAITSNEERKRRRGLYRMVGLRSPDDEDDDIPF